MTLIGFNDSVFTLTRNHDQSGRPGKGGRSAGRVGGTTLYDIILRQHRDMLGRQVGRKAIVVFSGWRRRREPRRSDGRRATAAGEATSRCYDRTGTGRHDGAAQEGVGQAFQTDRRPRAVYRPVSMSCTTPSTICSRSCRSSIFSDTHRPRASATTQHTTHQGERGRPVSGSSAAGDTARHQKMTAKSSVRSFSRAP